MDNRPIGVFDSGLGGLTAVKQLEQVLPGESIVYFGDTGRVPYGSRGNDTILRYAKQDMAFLLSQNNNIPRIRSIIDKLTLTLGKRKELLGESYYTFPSAAVLAEKDESFFRDLGAGYRAKFLVSAAKRLAEEGTERLSALDTPSLVKELTGFYGIGEKVADCIALFGFGRQECFPVDTWIDKVYRENFHGEIKERNKISEYFTERFSVNAGYYQQYLFYYKRSLEKNMEKNITKE